MAELIRGLDPGRIRANLEEARARIGRDDVAILAAVKYVALEELGALAEAGIEIAGENRAQDLERKHAAHPELVWDFIGHLQSRKVKQVLPLVRWIHSVGSDSVLRELRKHGAPETEVLIEVNVAREEGKSGFLPEELPGVLERCPVRVRGLMTMPPLAQRAQDSRRWFAALAQLAADNGLPELSMGTSQDYEVAAQEGATIVRLGSSLYR
ncbi:MAG TPA: YggS family pyridoxal phosphate enzyme [Solirubrobacteraceae bacterium]|nr:YggS family pyridoxal phosphate enzyme [Solirubrobacteraceae bacterium]